MPPISRFINYLYCWIYSNYILPKNLNKILQEPDWPFVSFCFIIPFYLLSLVLSLAVICGHLLSLFITCCYSLSLVVTRCHSLSLVVTQWTTRLSFIKRYFFLTSDLHFFFFRRLFKKGALSFLQNPSENTCSGVFSFSKVAG